MVAVLADTHCHLDLEQFDADREEVLQRAAQAGVSRVLVPGIDLAGSRRAVALAESHPMLRAAVGVHPNSAAGFSPDARAEIRDLAQHEKVDAIGEIGIDLYWKTTPLEQQRQALLAQLELAAELDLPVIIHDRDAHDEVLLMLEECTPPAGVVLHSFSGDLDMARLAVRAGWYLGVDGPLTFKKNDGLRQIFADAPLEHILIETDAPYLAPEPVRGRRNEPANVRYVVEALAALRGARLDDVATATTANAARLFRWEQAA